MLKHWPAPHNGYVRTVQVEVEAVGTIPLAEVSGLCIGRDREHRATLVAFGDHSSTVAWAGVDADPRTLEWQTLTLDETHGSQIPARGGQVEAVAVDGDLGVLVVQEHPNRAEVVDARARQVRASIVLEVPDAPDLRDLHASWVDPAGSHAEGVVLLADGHLLVVKEKDPAALIEFGPRGDDPAGFGPARWLADGDAWDVADGTSTLQALAVWRPDPRLTDECPDFSDAAVGPAGTLLLLSDQGRAVAAVPAQEPAGQPFAGSFDALVVFGLRGIRHKPEGLAVLPEGDILIACDRRKVRTNLYLVRRSAWEGVL